MLRNLSTGIEASATGESLNSGDVAVHPAARHTRQTGSAGVTFFQAQPTRTPLTNMLSISSFSSCALKMCNSCSLELAYIDNTSVLKPVFFCVRVDTFCCISLASPLSLPFAACAQPYLLHLSHITTPLLRACKTTCSLTHNLLIAHEHYCCCCLRYAVLSCLSTTLKSIDSLICCMRAAILCCISLASSVVSPLLVPWLIMCRILLLLRVCKIVHKNM